MLGGYCKLDSAQVSKSFPLPAHTHVKITASFHFIDRWAGETAFMKLNVGPDAAQEVVWTERYEEGESTNGLNVCGDPNVPEGNFASPIEVVVPHTRDSIEVVFGTTMQSTDACDRSWGISNVEIQVK